MSIHLRKLERLQRLRASGVLSDIEFQVEKRRLLEGGERWSLMSSVALVCAAVAGLAAAGWVVYSLMDAPNDQPVAAAPRPKQATPPLAPGPPPATPAPPRVADISSPFRLTADGGCAYSAQIDRAFRRMLRRNDATGRVEGQPVTLAGMAMTPRVTSEGQGDIERTYTSRITPTRPTSWNGLRVIGMEAFGGHEVSSDALLFAEPPSRVRDVARRLGVELPLPPGQRELPVEVCFASVAIEARANGSALRCGGGC